MIKHSQNSQNSKFAMSLQYLIKEVRDEVDFLHADKQVFYKLISRLWTWSFLQGDTVIIDGHDTSILKVLKVTSL